MVRIDVIFVSKARNPAPIIKGPRSATTLEKNVPILQKGGITLTLLAIRVVLLHELRFVQSFNCIC